MLRPNKRPGGRFFSNFIKSVLLGNNHVEYRSVLEEEAMRSPFRTIVANFRGNRIAVTASVIFLLILVSCFTLSQVFPLELTYYDLSQSNVRPGFGIMAYPADLNGKVSAIGTGSSFGAAIDANGKLYQWNGVSDPGTNKKLWDIPQEAADLKMVSAGLDHVLAVTRDNKVLTWGNNRLKLDRVPPELKDGEVPVKQTLAANQFSLALTEDGYLYIWGNSNLVSVDQDTIKKTLQHNISKVATTSNNILLLMNDGTVQVIGMPSTVFSALPENMPKLVDIAAGETTAAGITEDGRVVVWGNNMYGLYDVPEQVMGKAVKIAAGRYHFTVLTEEGRVYSWGRDTFGQASAPDLSNIKDIYAGYFQNYAVDEKNNIHTWGLTGYLMGTDDQGRDVFRRLLSGGRLTLTVGAVAVLISLFIGVIVGGTAGFYGGRIDNILMRGAEVVGSIPFLPLAMTLSSLIGNGLGETGRIVMIMVILGVLSWPGLARLIRGQILAEREKEFVTAAKALGIRERVIIFRHILPNVISVVIVNTTLSYAISLLTESSLSFLGFGVVPPNPTWGNMLTGSQATKVIRDYWWRWVFPAAALAISTISINSIGDGLRDAIDPKSNER